MKYLLTYLRITFLIIMSFFLSGCLSNIWTGVTLIYDRHSVYRKINNFQLAASVNRVLYKDTLFKTSDGSIDAVVFNGDVLLVGQVPTAALREEANRRVASVHGIRRLFNQIVISRMSNNSLLDSWITAKIRSEIFADSEIEPRQFKVITSRQIVYLMGDVIPEQAAKVILIARKCSRVRRVVKLFQYYNLSDNAV
jgi:osmotically-inducible protein OsmY